MSLMLTTIVKFFMTARSRSTGLPTWCAVPLSHPDLARMSLAELADLPIDAVETPQLPAAASRHRADMPFRA